MVSDWTENGTINQFIKTDPDANRVDLVCCHVIPVPQKFTDAYLAYRRRDGPVLYA